MGCRPCPGTTPPVSPYRHCSKARSGMVRPEGSRALRLLVERQPRPTLGAVDALRFAGCRRRKARDRVGACARPGLKLSSAEVSRSKGRARRAALEGSRSKGRAQKAQAARTSTARKLERVKRFELSTFTLAKLSGNPTQDLERAVFTQVSRFWVVCKQWTSVDVSGRESTRVAGSACTCIHRSTAHRIPHTRRAEHAAPESGLRASR